MTSSARTEREVAADVVARLLDAQVIPRTPAAVATAAQVLGLTIPEIRTASDLKSWIRMPLNRRTPAMAGAPLPRRLEVKVESEPEVPTEEPIAVPDVKPKPKRVSSWNERQRLKKEPRPGVRTCSRCKLDRPKRAFKVKSHRTGQLRSMCMDCEKRYNADRYLSIEKMDKLGPVLRLILQDGDAAVGACCASCSQDCKVGDELVVSDARFHHAHHFA